MNTTAANSIRRAVAENEGTTLFVASLDAGSLPDMGDRSLDQETHAFIRPRRRGANGMQKVVRRTQLPFPEPRLPDLHVSLHVSAPVAGEATAERNLRQVEENAGLRFIRSVEAPKASDSQCVVATEMGSPAKDSVKRAIAAQAFVMAPPPRETTLVIQPPFDLPHSSTAARRNEPVGGSKASVSLQSVARFTSIEEGIARMSERKTARIAVLAIGVSERAIGKISRLADTLRSRYSRKVELLAAEQLDGLKLATSLMGEGAGQVSLVACQAGSPWQVLPFLGQFDGVVLMIEIGATPVDEAAAWAEAIRRNETPIVGVLAA